MPLIRKHSPYLYVFALLAVLVIAPPARAELVGEFDVTLKNFKPRTGAYTSVFEGRIYDTSGAPTAPVVSAQLRLPRGAKIREEYVGGRFTCNTVVLEATLNASSCKSARFATGSMVLDGRPALADPVSTTVQLFLAPVNIDDVKDGARGQIAMLVEGTAAFKTQVIYGTIYEDSRRAGYRLSLPTQLKTIDPNVRLNLAELNLVNKGLVVRTLRRARRPGRRIFWSTLPRCNSKRKIAFSIEYQLSAAAPVTKARTIRCPRFLRRKH